MTRKLDFPKCKDRYVPHSFSNQGEKCNFGQLVNTVVDCTEKVVLIDASPGMGKTRAAKEIYTQLVLRGQFVVFVKVSKMNYFWNTRDENPSAEDFLKECMDFNKFQQRPEGDKMIVVLDGFDEICPNFRDKVLALVKNLLLEGTKVLITSRPQEIDTVKNTLIGQEIISVAIEPFALHQKMLMLQTRLYLDENRLVQI